MKDYLSTKIEGQVREARGAIAAANGLFFNRPFATAAVAAGLSRWAEGFRNRLFPPGVDGASFYYPSDERGPLL